MTGISAEQAQGLRAYLDAVVKHRGSDLFLTVGAPPSIKVQGLVQQLDLPRLRPGEVLALVRGVMTEQQFQQVPG